MRLIWGNINLNENTTEEQFNEIFEDITKIVKLVYVNEDLRINLFAIYI